MSDVLSDAYEGTATLGRVSSIIGAIVGTLFGLVLIGVGIFVAVRQPIQSTSNTNNSTNNNSTNNNSTTNYIAAAVLIGFGILIIVLSWVVVYFSSRYKFFAAAEGVGTIADLLSPNSF
jgi:vacuolar-type H+-ATPase subunit I/STV1